MVFIAFFIQCSESLKGAIDSWIYIILASSWQLDTTFVSLYLIFRVSAIAVVLETECYVIPDLHVQWIIICCVIYLYMCLMFHHTVIAKVNLYQHKSVSNAMLIIDDVKNILYLIKLSFSFFYRTSLFKFSMFLTYHY